MSDLISRQDAIDYIKTQRGRPFIGITLEEAIIMMIEEVPSAEKAQLSEEDATSDLISRKEAIDEILSLTNCDTVEELRAYVIEHDLGSWWSGGVLSSVGKVERLPSAGGCKCPCEYREPCDVCHYDAYREHGCPAEEGLKDE